VSAAPPAVAAVIPVKPLALALGRLAAALDAPGRRALQAAMLADVLAACRGTAGLGPLLVVTVDPAAAALARAGGAQVVADHAPPRGMNAAVLRGLAAAEAAGAAAALVLTADLPLARADDLAALLAAAPVGPGVTIAPSRDGTGTNALLLRPLWALRPQLGPGSLARHSAGAAAAGLALALVERPRLALDLDTPADLAAFCAGAPGGASGALCERLGLVPALVGASAP
jgi:2-phospho-L-lactate/phosphoenolpyruvate guanylyltransferase